MAIIMCSSRCSSWICIGMCMFYRTSTITLEKRYRRGSWRVGSLLGLLHIPGINPDTDSSTPGTNFWLLQTVIDLIYVPGEITEAATILLPECLAQILQSSFFNNDVSFILVWFLVQHLLCSLATYFTEYWFCVLLWGCYFRLGPPDALARSF